MATLVVVAVVAFLAGYIFHATITKYLKAGEAKADADAKVLIKSAEAEAKKL